MKSIRFVAMPTELARAYQAGALDAKGQAPERHVSDGDGVPCRHCQRDVAAGEPYLVLAYRPFAAAQPYAEQGPIFLHAEPCERYAETGEAPAMFLKRGAYLIRGYGGNDRIVYGTGEIVSPGTMAERAKDMFERPEVSYIHVRSSTNNCFQLRIERA